MPFKSAAQRRWMFWKYPKMAKRWTKETPKGKKLPERIGRSKKRKNNMSRKRRRIRTGTPAGYRAGLWGQKIRSRGRGKGLGRGKGRGPIGVPIGIKEKGETPFIKLERTARRKVRRLRRRV